MPDWKQEIKRRLSGVRLDPAREAAIVEEFAQYLDDCYAELLASGAAEIEARRQTLAELDESERLERELRLIEREAASETVPLGLERRTNERRRNMIADLWQDLHFGSRLLARRPGFTILIVFTLALGIGLSTAVFSLVNAVLLEPAPYRDPDRLVQLARTQQGRPRVQVPPADFADWREQSRSFEKMGASQFFDANISGGSNISNISNGSDISGGALPERARGAAVTASIFSLLGIQPLLGRWPDESEEQSGSEPLVVIGHRLWRQYFNSDPQVIGRSVRINSREHSVIAVMPEGFRFPAPYWAAAEVWVLGAQHDINWTNRRTGSLLVFARLKEGIERREAQAEMETIAARLAESHPATNKGAGVLVTEYGGTDSAASRRPLLLLLAAAGLVLLIACVNVVNLLLGRSAARSREIAIRAALGAGRRRIIRQLLAESLLLFALGGAAGLLLASASIRMISVELRSYSIPRMEEANIDATVALFSILLSLVSGLAAGLLPALRYSDIRLSATLGESGRSAGMSRGWQRFQQSLIVAQMALALVLLAGAGLLFESFRGLSQIDPGFKVENLHHLRLQLPASRYPTAREQSAFYERALEEIGTIAGVDAVCAVDVPPGVGAGASQPFSLPGEPRSGDASSDTRSERKAALRLISPDYFRALEAPLKEGRAFTAADAAGRPAVAIINETLARRVFPDRSAIGEKLQLKVSAAEGEREEVREIVGIASDLKEDYLFTPAPPAIYLPLAQSGTRSAAYIVRAATASAEIIPSIRRRMTAIDSEQAIYGVTTLERLMASEYDLGRLNLVLVGVFAAVALLLALVGIYSVIAHAVRERTKEFGVRMALGAEPGKIVRMVIGEGLRLVALGVAGGLLAAWWLTRFLQSLLYGVSGTDPLIFAAVAVLLAGMALAACYLPARRASRVDPLAALRCE